MSLQNPRADRGVTLTRKGMVAAICLAAEPYIVPACQVTVYEVTAIRQDRGERTYRERPCGEHVSRDGLCRHHAEDRDRLMSNHATTGADV